MKVFNTNDVQEDEIKEDRSAYVYAVVSVTFLLAFCVGLYFSVRLVW